MGIFRKMRINFNNNGKNYYHCGQNVFGSLSFFETIMADINGVKISRNTIVFLPYVQDFKGKDVTISKEDSSENVTLHLGKSIPENTIHAIEDFIQKRKNNVIMQKSTVTRLLSELKQEGLIKYEGSKKTGGYRAVD